jgi:hypothetical protein
MIQFLKAATLAFGFFTGPIDIAAGPTNSPAPAAIDPAFRPGITLLKQTTGFIEPPAATNGWQPRLCLWVGVKVTENSKRTIGFVEMTALPPPLTNHLGQPWTPTLRTNAFSWSPTNKAEYISAWYPVRLRVFDESGKKLKEGWTSMPLGLATNGLMEMCRLSFEKYSGTNASALNPTNGPPDPDVMRSFGGGFLWMITVFGQLQTRTELSDIWSRAHCAFRLPGLWTLASSVFKGLTIRIEPHLTEVSTLSGPETDGGRWYRLPVGLTSNGRNLTSVEIIVGPGDGAEILLAGIRTIRAVHPTKPKQEFFAQVLAAGMSTEPAPAKSP